MKEVIRLHGTEYKLTDFQKAMAAANRAQHFTPLKQMSKKQKEELGKTEANKETPPDSEELEKYPEIRGEEPAKKKGPPAKKRGRPKKK